MLAASKDHSQFILENTAVCSPPHVPELNLHLADEAHSLWHKTEEELEQIGLQPPFWAFAWAGGQALARFILDHPDIVSGKRVLDFASGSGLVGIAAKLAGANEVTCVDIDPFCASAITLNAALSGIAVSIQITDLTEIINLESSEYDCVLAGDVFYDKQMVDKVWPMLQAFKRQGATILVGDPGRAYLPKENLEKCAEYQVPVTRVLEDSEIKQTSVWRLK
jgi:predicted nicotinamide N-methyase